MSTTDTPPSPRRYYVIANSVGPHWRKGEIVDAKDIPPEIDVARLLRLGAIGIYE